MPEPQPCHYCG